MEGISRAGLVLALCDSGMKPPVLRLSDGQVMADEGYGVQEGMQQVLQAQAGRQRLLGTVQCRGWIMTCL